MIELDLEHFVNTGTLGPFDSTSTRAQIEQLLGEPDPDGYPGFAVYGNLAFDLCNGDGPPCRIQIGFPHQNWMKWTDWPDARFDWKLGRFNAPVKIETALPMLTSFREQDVESSNESLRIFTNSATSVDLMSEFDAEHNTVTLSNITAHP